MCERKVTTTHHNDRMQVDPITQLRSSWRRIGLTCQSILKCLAIAIAVFVLMYVLHATFLSSEQDFMLWERCRAGDPAVRDLCKASRSASSLGAATAAAVIAVITYVVYRFSLNHLEN